MTIATPASAPRPALLTKGRNVIAVASGKGGVGKTWFSITLSHALARAGRRTLLFDGDLGLANVDIQLGLTPDRDLGGVVTGRIGLHQAAARFELGGFDIIAGRSGTGSLATLPAQRLAQLDGDRPADGIGATTRRRRHHQTNSAVGIGCLRLCSAQQASRENGEKPLRREKQFHINPRILKGFNLSPTACAQQSD